VISPADAACILLTPVATTEAVVSSESSPSARAAFAPQSSTAARNIAAPPARVNLNFKFLLAVSAGVSGGGKSVTQAGYESHQESDAAPRRLIVDARFEGTGADSNSVAEHPLKGLRNELQRNLRGWLHGVKDQVTASLGLPSSCA
jgi:hypothetical protein